MTPDVLDWPPPICDACKYDFHERCDPVPLVRVQQRDLPAAPIEAFGGPVSHDHGQTCTCVTEHRPKVVELDRHHIWPLYLGGPDTPDNLAWVCPNTHRAAHELLRLYLKTDSAPPGDVLNDYPRRARELAAEGYRRWKDSQ